jgi:hypothetical protein
MELYTLGEFGAVAHQEFITTTLRFYHRTCNDLQFATGDNCSTNKSIADKLNLAVNHFLSITPSTCDLLDKVNELMKDLKKLKNASILRSIKDTNGLMPVTRNVTRWSSTWEMLVRFLILKPYLHNCGLPEATKALIPTYVEIHELNELKDQLQDFQDATLSLQSDSGEIDLYFVRTLFDNLIRKHPSCVKHLSPTSDIVHSKYFENGIVKIQA